MTSAARSDEDSLKANRRPSSLAHHDPDVRNRAAVRIDSYGVHFMDLVVRFVGTLWEYQGEAPWVFITLPIEDADEILERVPERRGFGSVRVSVAIGGSRWQTSVFPDKAAGSFVLPVKREIREREGLSPGDTADVELRIAVE